MKRKTDIEESDVKKIKENGVQLPKSDKPPTVISPLEIQNMMANATKILQEHKKAMSLRQSNNADNIVPEDKQLKINQLRAQIQSKFNKLNPPAKMTGPDKPAPLILDSEGRTVDMSGREVQLTHVVPTLKANIRARKRDHFTHQTHDKSAGEAPESKFVDPRIPTKSSVRSRRGLKFNEPGKYQQMAHGMRVKAKLAILQSEIALNARRTGISSAAKLAQLKPDGEEEVEEIPCVEWWDSVILKEPTYDTIEDINCIHLVNEATITHLVEHPIQLKPPTDPMKPVPLPLFLTKVEQKKLRRQNRREAWKEEQEKIRLGLVAPPEPKLRISNLMRVLGNEAVQDPTKMEAHVRAQMEKRRKAHEDANAARKLNPEQKREKTIRKIKEDTSLGVNVAVYRISDLSSQSKKFKVEKNANQLFLTGCVVMFQDCNVVVVEGGPKQQRKYKRLMLHRIKWEEDTIKTRDGDEMSNKCVLVWEGMTKQRSFGEMKFKACATEKLARDQLRKHKVEQYWDLAYSGTVLEQQDEK